jgi:hypothetical protein
MFRVEWLEPDAGDFGSPEIRLEYADEDEDRVVVALSMLLSAMPEWRTKTPYVTRVRKVEEER